MYRIAALLLTLAPLVAFAPPDLPAAEYERIMRAVIVTENVIRDYQRFLENPVQSAPNTPLTPSDGAGRCGDAAQTAAYFMIRQGVPADRLRIVNLRRAPAFGENAFPHTVLVYVASNGQTVVIDPTGRQIETRTYDLATMRFLPEGQGHPPGPVLVQSVAGRSLVDQIGAQGFWIATPELLRALGDALCIDPRSGAARPHHNPTMEEFASGNFLLRPTTSLPGDVRQIAGLTDVGIDAALQEVTPETIRSRVAAGDPCILGLGAAAR